MSLFKGLMLDEKNCRYLLEDIKSKKVFRFCKKPEYHSFLKRPFLAIGVLLGLSMCVWIKEDGK